MAARPPRQGSVAATSIAAIARRKGEHLTLAAERDVETLTRAGWDDIHLVHDALPTLDASEVDLATRFLGRSIRLPLVISGMTGGHARASEVNAILARAAEKAGVAIGVGSQRAALRDPRLVPTYSIVRECAPSAFVIANIGVSQLVAQDEGTPLDREDVAAVVKMVGADAIALHLNYLEECVQPEGQTRARGAAAAIRSLVRRSPVPVIAKETGAGISREVALRLAALGVRAIDVGGVGGTSFAAIEAIRASDRSDARRQQLGERFRDWGMPTAVCVAGAAAARLPIIATGGVRSGLDAAKALALGATLVGIGRPLLQRALEGQAAVDEWLARFALELRTAIFLSGGRSVRDLHRGALIVGGDTAVWLAQLGYKVRSTSVASRR